MYTVLVDLERFLFSMKLLKNGSFETSKFNSFIQKQPKIILHFCLIIIYFHILYKMFANLTIMENFFKCLEDVFLIMF